MRVVFSRYFILHRKRILFRRARQNKRKIEDFMETLHVVLTALLSVAALFVITKIMGHKQVAQLDFFDYVSGIRIGSI